MSSRHTAQSSAPRSAYRQLLLHGIGWAGGLSLLSGGVTLAQTADPAASVPSAQELIAPAAPAPEPAAQPEPVVRPQPEIARPEAIAPVEAPRPAPVRQAAPRRAAPTPVVEAPVQRSVPSANTYIDTTNYSIGATQRDEQRPGSIVLSERSTGCQFTLRQGASVPNSVCANRRIPAAGSTARNATASSVAASRGIPALVSRSQRAIARSIGTRPISASSATASGSRFYNLTVRPPGRIGNNNTAIIFPLSIPAAITSVFGWRVHPIAGTRRFHSGTDLGAPMGTPVLAAYSGQVARADWMRGYGLTVVLNHDPDARDRNSFEPVAETLYAHMSELFVQPGQWVNQGEVIGRVGSTGYSTGPHLHFEYRELTAQGWQKLDPGQMLETSLAQLIQALQTAQARPAGDRG
ncbi:peptidoglycan DD-metalloendopeptidase family protein [Microcoleus sp. FACHB-1515]|nr:peptidoglycan DD-metalloendopeptidase family protein [Microcoleus sp. FACHB-1515]